MGRRVIIREVTTHRLHLHRNLGDKTMWSLASCDCGWIGDSHTVSSYGYKSTSLKAALKDYADHLKPA